MIYFNFPEARGHLAAKQQQQHAARARARLFSSSVHCSNSRIIFNHSATIQKPARPTCQHRTHCHRRHLAPPSCCCLLTQTRDLHLRYDRVLTYFTLACLLHSHRNHCRFASLFSPFCSSLLSPFSAIRLLLCSLPPSPLLPSTCHHPAASRSVHRSSARRL